MEYSQPLMRYTHTNNSLLSSGNTKKSTTYEPRTEAISPAINDDILNAEDSTSKSTKDEQTLIVEKLKKVEAEISQTALQILRLRRQKEQLEQAANSANKNDDDQENVCDTKQLSIAKLVYHENRAKAQRTPSKLDCIGGYIRDLPVYNQPTDNAIYHHNTVKFNQSFKKSLVNCFKSRITTRVKLEESVSTEYDRRMEKWLKSIEIEDSQTSKRIKDAKQREFFEKQFPELKKARESGERFSRVGQRVARSDAEVAELMDGITEREDQDKKVKSYAVIPPMLEEMRSRKPKFINTNGYVDDIVAEYKEYQILNTWTDEEKDIFKENYLQHPKDFGLISRMTTRKNVANCVAYYYLSKKSENYKQLLKRQQKRRTRSFVRPAQATPANTAALESNNDKNANGNDKQACDSNMTDVNNGSDLANDSKLSAFSGQMGNDGLNGTNLDEGGDQLVPKCCICECNFSETNQSRNVTRSNHQIYGIGLELLKPGLKICYSCRFRHVRHPSFDDPAQSPEPMEDVMMMDEQPSSDMMDVDMMSIKCEPNSGANCNLPPQLPGAPLQTLSPTNQPEGGETPKGTKRTCVRDIIYQAIEMSFQKQEAPGDGQPKLEPVRSDCIPPVTVTVPVPVPASAPTIPILPQHPPIPGIPAGPVYGLPPHFRPVQPIVPANRHRFIDDSAQIRQQQYHMQSLQQQQQLHQQHMRPAYPNILPRSVNPPMPPLGQQQLQQPLMSRLPGQPFQTTSPQPNHLTPVMQPVQINSLLSTVVPISSPHMAPIVRPLPSAPKQQQQQQQQPPPLPQSQLPPQAQQQAPPTSTQNHMLPTGVHHPLNLCRKYSDPVLAQADVLKLQGKSRPPVAHSGKVGQAASGSVDDGVLNLSSKNQSPTTTPQPNQQGPPPQAPHQQPTSYTPPIMPLNSAPSAQALQLPLITSRVSPPQSGSPKVQVPPAQLSVPKAKQSPPPATIAANPTPLSTQPQPQAQAPPLPTLNNVKIEATPNSDGADQRKSPSSSSPPTLTGLPKQVGASETALAPAPALATNPSPKQERLATTPPPPPARPEANCEQSRSPNLTGSPTSPSEMVIDESADVASPAASDQGEEEDEARVVPIRNDAVGK